jgi:hypothetical protein
MCCDLCGEATECLQNETDGQEFGVCESCPLAEKLSVVGSVKASLEKTEELEEEEYEETLI